MNQSINTDSKNSKEPQQKYRLGTVSIKILGGLNRFYRRLTSPSGSIMAQNIQLFISVPYGNRFSDSRLISRENMINNTCIYPFTDDMSFHRFLGPDILICNAITQNICFVKGSHKYDVFLRDKNKAHLN